MVVKPVHEVCCRAPASLAALDQVAGLGPGGGVVYKSDIFCALEISGTN